jgi:hypothetical protein
VDQVYLTRRVLRTLADKDLDYTVTAVHYETGMVFAEPTKYIGQGKGKWLQADGSTRDGGKF